MPIQCCTRRCSVIRCTTSIATTIQPPRAIGRSCRRACPFSETMQGWSVTRPWSLSFLTCAAPYAPAIGRLDAEPMLRQRIHRVLSIARAYQYESLVLGAWGCGAFANEPMQTAKDFRTALEGDFAGAFARIIFAITDWSEQRRYLRPFCDVFSEG